MDVDRQRQEVDRNYDVFMRQLGDLLPEHQDQYALMRDGEIVAFFDKAGDAHRAGLEIFAGDQIFSLQQVTLEMDHCPSAWEIGNSTVVV